MLKTFKALDSMGFRLFPCRLDKAPDVPKGVDWRDPEVHLTPDKAAVRAYKGQFVGAWIPEHIVVIDVDNHKKEGEEKTGIDYFRELLEQLDILEPVLQSTFSLKTGSGGYHLYFKKPETIERFPGKLIDQVDIKTHTGYVIAPGSSGYTVICDKDISELPHKIEEYILNRIKSKKESFSIQIDNPLSIDRFTKVLDKLDPCNFDDNEKWLEFIMASIATCGKTPEVVDLLTKWSRRDSRYENDISIGVRIESIEPEGGITPGTFLYILRRENVSDYTILKVRDEIGGSFAPSISKELEISIPIKIDYDIIISTYFKEVAGFFYNVKNTDPAFLLSNILKDRFIYVIGEKQFYFFDGNKWIKYYDIYRLTYTILMNVLDYFYLYMTKREDADPDLPELRVKAYLKIQETRWKRDTLSELKESLHIAKESIQWDSPRTAETLTLEDCVIDFTGKDIHIRNGYPEEYRRDYIDIKKLEFVEKESVYWARLLETLFPDEGTRKTARAGISLMVSGLSSYRVFQVWYGGGRNGKSTLMENLKKIFGKRAMTYDTNVLMPNRVTYGNALTPELATFQGKLVAFGSETESNKKISTGMVKNMVGGDTIKANPKHKDPIEFESTWQLILSTNYLPNFDAHDKAFIDRLILLPFKSKFYFTEKEKDRFIEKGEKFLFPADNRQSIDTHIYIDRGSILYEIVKDYISLREKKAGLHLSDECKKARQSYIKDNDDIGDFIRETFIFDPEGSVKSSDIIAMYHEFCGSSKLSARFIIMQVLNTFTFLEKAVKKIDGKSCRVLTGIALKNDTEDSF